MKTILKIVFLFLSIQGFLGCGDDAQTPLPTNDELSRMSAEERKAQAPNKAFEAVFRNSSEEVEGLLTTDPNQFRAKNVNGMTPAMVAISKTYKDLALMIVNHFPISDLYDADANGRGYMSYASQYGMVEVIDVIGEKYINGPQIAAKGFRNIDFSDSSGKSALFYAANSNVAGSLHGFWTSWSIAWVVQWAPISDFYNKKDSIGQNFIHTAVTDNRYDVLNWAMEKVCGPPLLHDADGFFGTIGRKGMWGFNGVEGWIRSSPVNAIRDMVNQQTFKDVSEENTPLHLAVRNGNKEAARILMACEDTKYRYQNVFGRTPLAELLFNIDPTLEEVPSNYKEIFDVMITKKNTYYVRLNFLQKMIDDQDLTGYSSLHYAARLKDKYFYEVLAETGNIYLEADDGMTPESLFLQTR